MQEQGSEKQQCRHQSGRPDRGRTPLRRHFMKVSDQGERDEHRNDEPAKVQPDLNPGDSDPIEAVLAMALQSHHSQRWCVYWMHQCKAWRAPTRIQSTTGFAL